MRYDDMVKYFETDEDIAKLLGKLAKDYFDEIDSIGGQLIGGVLTTTDELNTVKTQLAAIIANLQPIYSKALSLKKQKEYRFYVSKKLNSETIGVKFTDGSATIEAKDAVRNYRNARDLICGYLKSAESLYYDTKDRVEANRKEYLKTDK
jgi:hypothetical protein